MSDHVGCLPRVLMPPGGAYVQLLDDAPGFHPVVIGMVVAATDGRSHKGQRHARVGPRIVHAWRHSVEMHRHVGSAKPLGEPFRPLGQHVPKTLPVSDLFHQNRDREGIAPLELQPPCLRGSDHSLLEQVVGQSDGVACADGVYPQAVAQVAQVGQGTGVVDE